MTTTSLRLGRVQLQILQILWRRGPSTARQILDDMAQAGPVARSTVQTLLRQLEAKEIVGHTTTDAGVFIFHALREESDVAETAADDLLERVYQGSLYNLVAHLLRPERISPEELGRLRELIDSKRADSGIAPQKETEP